MKTLFPAKTASIASGLLVCLASSAQASPSLSYSSNAYVYGSLESQYTSALLGDVSFTMRGASDSQYTNGNVARVSYSVPAGANTGGVTDPIYDIVTDYGQYGFSYSGQAQVLNGKLKTELTSSMVDADGNAVDNTTNTDLYSHSSAYWSQQMYIAPTANRQSGSYGAIVVGITLDGSFPASADPNISNDSDAYLSASSSFTDTAGVSYTSSFNISAYPGSWTDGSQTVYKKLLFQYGTPFSLTLDQWISSYGNGIADFFNTGKISSIEIPYAATLETGAQQAGLGSLNELFGHVFNSATQNAENTNWDFGNNGGGFTPPSQVPVPAAMWLFGSGLIGLIGIQRKKQILKG